MSIVAWKNKAESKWTWLDTASLAPADVERLKLRLAQLSAVGYDIRCGASLAEFKGFALRPAALGGAAAAGHAKGADRRDRVGFVFLPYWLLPWRTRLGQWLLYKWNRFRRIASRLDDESWEDRVYDRAYDRFLKE